MSLVWIPRGFPIVHATSQNAALCPPEVFPHVLIRPSSQLDATNREPNPPIRPRRNSKRHILGPATIGSPNFLQHFLHFLKKFDVFSSHMNESLLTLTLCVQSVLSKSNTTIEGVVVWHKKDGDV
eukprot:scaffold44473_cov48-Attheya_sp.AAC.1